MISESLPLEIDMWQKTQNSKKGMVIIMNNIIDTKKQIAKPKTAKGEYFIRIPKDPLNKNDEMVKICINSKEETFIKGKDYTVSKYVKDLLEKAKYI